MSVEAVKEYLKPFGLSGQVLELAESSATVELAAHALGTQPARIAKTLSFLVGEEAILIVAAGDAKIDNAKYKAQFHQKAKMLTPQQVLELVGHPVGGVCPFAIREGVAVYLDESLKRFETVFPACGSGNSAIQLTIPQLEETSRAAGWGGCVQGLLKKERASRPLLFFYPSNASLEAAPTWVAYFPVKHPVHRSSLLPRQASSSPATLM